MGFLILYLFSMQIPDVAYRAQIAWGLDDTNLVWEDTSIVEALWRGGIPDGHSRDIKKAGVGNILWWNSTAPFSTPHAPATVIIGLEIAEIGGPYNWIGIYRTRFQARVNGVIQNWCNASDWTIVVDWTKFSNLSAPHSK